MDRLVWCSSLINFCHPFAIEREELSKSNQTEKGNYVIFMFYCFQLKTTKNVFNGLLYHCLFSFSTKDLFLLFMVILTPL